MPTKAKKVIKKPFKGPLDYIFEWLDNMPLWVSHCIFLTGMAIVITIIIQTH